jgi:hypothetical protein
MMFVDYTGQGVTALCTRVSINRMACLKRDGGFCPELTTKVHNKA